MYSSEKPVSISIMLVMILILSIFVSAVGLIGGGANAELGAPVQIPLQGSWITYGPWVIQSGDTLTQSSKTITINGDITVQSGGKLTLRSCKLLMNSPSNINPLTITVETGGELTITNCQIKEYLPTNFSTPDYWAFECSGKLTMQATRIEHLWGGITNPGSKQFIPGGLNIQDASSVEITNCTIKDPLNTGIYLDNTDAYVGYNEIYGANRSIYCTNGKDVKFIENKIYDSTRGLQVIGADDCLVRGNNIHHNFFGVELESTDIIVQDNRIVRTNRTPGPVGISQIGGDGLMINNCDGEVSGNTVSHNSRQDVGISNGQIDFHNNTITNDGLGVDTLVRMSSCSNSLIRDNLLKDEDKIGMDLTRSSNLQFGNNTFIDCHFGIRLQDSWASKLNDNTFNNNEIGLYLDQCNDAILTNNTFNSLNNTTDLYIQNSNPVYSYNNSFDKDKLVDW